MNLANILLMAGAGGESLQSFIPLILIIVVFYFFMIRPQVKKTKDEKKFREGIEKGAKIVTIGGIHGKIVDVQDSTILLEVENGTKLKVQKEAISMDSTKALS